MTEADTRNLGGARSSGAAAAPNPAGLRVVLDARPLQEPDRAPLTAQYLDALLRAYNDAPVDGESFALLLASDAEDPTEELTRLDVIGRRLLPPTRLLRSGALTVDPFLLSGASLGAAWRAERSGAAGSVYHAAGGSIPLATGVPLVVTLLDLAPWELPGAYQRSVATRFGQRLRAQLLRDAAAVIVGSVAVARAARRLLHVRRERIHVVRLAARAAFRPANGANGGMVAAGTRRRPSGADPRAERDRLGLPERYVIYSGRYDARQDMNSLLSALRDLEQAGRPAGLAADEPWPPRVLFAGATPDDRAALARAAAREGVGEALVYAPRLDDERLAALVRGARAALLPVVSDSAGLPAIEAIACGVPVVASSVGALPEIVGAAGILVEPRDARRLASALETVFLDDRVHATLAGAALERATTDGRSWADVARETRAVYASVGVARDPAVGNPASAIPR
ncbi:MAG TPA: glycosyltransferase [Candidatus Limnocylindrales bacterium]|nr:glycosyltransferase [Candidatus Limnocylindrales bacterium]